MAKKYDSVGTQIKYAIADLRNALRFSKQFSKGWQDSLVKMEIRHAREWLNRALEQIEKEINNG